RKRKSKLPPSSMPSSSRPPASKNDAGPGVRGVCDHCNAVDLLNLKLTTKGKSVWACTRYLRAVLLARALIWSRAVDERTPVLPMQRETSFAPFHLGRPSDLSLSQEDAGRSGPA